MVNTMAFNAGNDDFCILVGLMNKLRSVGIEVFDTGLIHPMADKLETMTEKEKIRFAEESLLLDFSKFEAESFGFQKKEQ